uniref:Uncharacterized protein n=1 Tax=Arundo donax TaxID=35708 RepID=A0A0A9H7A9_ARUDO
MSARHFIDKAKRYYSQRI